MFTYRETYKAVCSDCSLEFQIFAEQNASAKNVTGKEGNLAKNR